MSISEKTDNRQIGRDDAYLIEQWAKGTPRRKIARHLGVTVRTVHNRALKLGLVGSRREWTAEEDELVRNQAHRWSWTRLGEELNRPPSAVEARAKLLGVRAPGDMLCATTCAQLMGRDPRTVEGWIKRKELRGYVSDGGVYRVWPKALRDFIVANPTRVRLGRVGSCARELFSLLADEWGSAAKHQKEDRG